VAEPYKKDQCIDLIKSFDAKGDVFWKKRNTIKVFKVDGEEWNIKSFKTPHLINKIVYKYFRKSKARRSFEHAQKLLSKSILTPNPIAYSEFSNVIGLGKSFYISQNLHYDFTFNELYNLNFPDRENILNQFTEFTFRLHKNGIHHFDHSRGNTLIVEKENKFYDFYLVDLNRMVFENMDFEKSIKNFDRLSLTSEMIAIISKKYASLIGRDEKFVFRRMTQVCEAFANNRARKYRLKKKFGL
jgi:tRNA A-37 threonylcarbamoyl transferase component Bud32